MPCYSNLSPFYRAKKALRERDYGTIIAVAQKVPEDVLQEDLKLLDWYENALMRPGENV